MTKNKQKLKRKKQRKLRKIKISNTKNYKNDKNLKVNSIFDRCLTLLGSFSPALFTAGAIISVVVVISSIFVQNFMQFSMEVARGMEFLEYQKSIEKFETTTDFNNLNRSTNIDVSDDEIKLNHLSDNAPDQNNGSWWDDDGDNTTDYNWEYRRCFDVNNTSGLIPDYQIYLDFPTDGYIADGEMNSDGSDIRFVDENGNDLSYYILDEINTDSTKAWVKLQDLAANDITTVCMYWGNPAATAKSDRLETFSYDNLQSQYYVLHDLVQGLPLTIGSYQEGNNINSGINSQIIDEYELSSNAGVTMQQFGILNDKPIQPNWEGAGTESLVPASAAGTQFVYELSRSTNNLSISSPFCTANLNIRGDVTGGTDYPISTAPTTVTQGTAVNFSTTNTAGTGLPNGATLMIESTNNCPVLVTHHGGGNNDGFVFYPANTEWIGTGTSSMEIAAIEDGTIVNVYNSNGGTLTYNLDRGDNISRNEPGSQGTEPAQYVVSNKPIGVKSIADADGNESTTFLPINELGKRFYLPEGTQYVAVAGLPNETITGSIYNDGTACGVGTPNATATDTSTSLTEPTKLYFGTTTAGTNFPQGACLVLSSPGHVIVERDSTEDEMNVWSPKQNRPFVDYISTAFNQSTTGSWDLGGVTTWTNRHEFSFTNNSSNNIDETPIFVPLENFDPAVLFANSQTEGEDLRVAGLLGDGSDTIPYSIDSFSTAAGDAGVWIQLPQINAFSTIDIAFYYNNISATTSTSDEFATFTYSTLKNNYYLVDEIGVNTSQIHIWGMVDGGTVEFLGDTFTSDEGIETLININSNVPGFFTYGDSIVSTGPLVGEGMTDATDSISPQAYAGTKFVTYAYRNSDMFNFLSTFGNTTATIYEGIGGDWILRQTVPLTQGVPVFLNFNIADGSGIKIEAPIPIMATHRTETIDAKILIPVDYGFVESTNQYELYGLSSGAGFITASEDNTLVTYYLDNGTDTTIILNEGSTLSINGPSQNVSGAVKVVANKPISGMSAADSDGTEAIIYLPKQEFNTTYVIPNDSQYIAVVSDNDNLSCELFDLAGTSLGSLTTTANGANYPNMVYFGNSASTIPVYLSGARVECNFPVYVMYEKQDSGNTVTDESNVLTYNQARKSVLVKPTIQSLRDALVFNEGLYEDGGTVDYTVDLNGVANSSTTSWETIKWIETLATNTDIIVQAATDNSNPCNGTSVTYQTITTNTDSNLSSLTPGSCFYLKITLENDDRQFTPILDEFELCYSISNPIPLGQDIVVNLNSNINPFSGKILQINSNNLDLLGKNSYLIYKGGINETNVNNLNVDLYNTNSNVNYNQFSSLPNNGDTGLVTAPFDNNIGLDLDYNLNTNNDTTLFFTYVIDLANDSSLITHDIVINIVNVPII